MNSLERTGLAFTSLRGAAQKCLWFLIGLKFALAAFAGADIDWRRKLQLPRPSEVKTKLSLPHQARPLLSQQRRRWLVLPCLLSFLVGGGLGWHGADAAQAWKDAKLDEQAQLIQQLQAQVRESERLLQQKAPALPAAPAAEPREEFPADRAIWQTEEADTLWQE